MAAPRTGTNGKPSPLSEGAKRKLLRQALFDQVAVDDV
jgi:hypothetical protein